ncbi:uroporphyrinogen-III synthase [Haloplanus aerogenes]|uniref:Uroporphyrinogen-III synthase n=1 Tax=Haloplanus aerogenes TaxID=660522 RepID=A0A3G8QRR0_9EURY|nr:uroporphyrinogen-III synthase [Haloplanus aerogenes]AZH24109.1 uroporphyrinogen-III synthase [Haloplanus aerogenes]RMB13113.1 uroporphyrinogen-III synthase [Haloplanus aerogenes]
MSASEDAPRVAVFRPDDDRLDAARSLLTDLGIEPVADPMLAVEPTGEHPQDADYVVFTSKTGAELVAGEWKPGDATVVAIGPKTADALESAGYAVDLVPDDYSSTGLVDLLADRTEGASVEVARSDHGSPVLLDGLRDASADVHETVLYRLVRPEGAGESAVLAAAGDLDAACFTSSLTVEHFLDAADERGIRSAAIVGLNAAVVGVIGEPTRETAESLGIEVDVVPAEATFEALARETVAALRER